jgi:uncharacterized protein YkvS
MAKTNQNKPIPIAGLGDTIVWEKKGRLCNGKVIAILNNSVVVEILNENALQEWGIEHDRTVVSHRRYQIVS